MSIQTIVPRFEPGESGEILRALGPIVDAHHHFWDLEVNSYPWLQGQPIATHYGDYSAIRRSYLPNNFEADRDLVALSGSVHVEAHWQDFVDPAGETEWLTELADRAQLPSAIVGHADLLADDLSAVLDRHQHSPLFRGVRMMSFRKQAPSGAALLEHPDFRRGLARLTVRGLSFDLQATPAMMPAAARLADAVPGQSLVLTHAGLPLDRSDDGMQLWRCGIAALAQRANVAVKLSGLPMADPDWTPQSLRPFALHLLEQFGAERVLFGSNFPVDGLFSTYSDLVAGYAWALEGTGVLDAVFRQNAARIYRLQPNKGRQR